MSAFGTILKIVVGKKTDRQATIDGLLNINETLRQEHQEAVHEAIEVTTGKTNGAVRHSDPLDDFFGDLKRGSA